MGKITRFSIWFACCVALGLALAYAEGIGVAVLVKTTLVMAVVGLAILLVIAAFRRTRPGQRSG